MSEDREDPCGKVQVNNRPLNSGDIGRNVPCRKQGAGAMKGQRPCIVLLGIWDDALWDLTSLEPSDNETQSRSHSYTLSPKVGFSFIYVLEIPGIRAWLSSGASSF